MIAFKSLQSGALLLAAALTLGAQAQAQSLTGSLAASGNYASQSNPGDRGTWQSTMKIQDNLISGTIFTKGDSAAGTDPALSSAGGNEWRIVSGEVRATASGAGQYYMSLSLEEVGYFAGGPRQIVVNLEWSQSAASNTLVASGRAAFSPPFAGGPYDVTASGTYTPDPAMGN